MIETNGIITVGFTDDIEMMRSEVTRLRAENERLKDVIAKCAEALDEALFTKHNETSFVFCTLKLERALSAIKEIEK